MSGNILGKLFTLTTAGESHGKGLMGIVDGCPSGLALSEADLQRDLDRRKPGKSRFETQRREDDEVHILSGVFEGKTTGTPIALLIHNKDQRSQDYSDVKSTFRPSHADYTYDQKYGFRDYRGGGRSSARETAMRVAAGGIAKKYLREQFGVNITGYLSALGPINCSKNTASLDERVINANPFFCADESKLPALEAYMTALKKEKNSIGAEISVVATGVPAGWGEPVFDRLDADLAKAFMSINAVKGVSIGDGFEVVSQKGTEHRDEMDSKGFLSNHAGGILGGISSSQPILAKMAIKPTASIMTPGRSVDQSGQAIEVVTKGRHDPCVGIRATPIAEAMMALTLMDHALRQRRFQQS